MMQNEKKASYKQIQKIKILTEELGLTLSKKRENTLRHQTSSEVSRLIDNLEYKLRAGGKLAGREAIANMATNKQLAYLFELQRKAHISISNADRAQLLASSEDDVKKATQEAMRALQDWNDSHGVPIPQWRVQRGFYDPEVLARNGAAKGRPAKPQPTPAPRKLTLEELV